MSMLARYRKAGGIMELVKLMEDSAETKRKTLMDMVRSEDADFARQVEARFLPFERLRTLPEAVQAEIYAVTPPKFVALSLVGDAPDYVKFVEKCLGKNFNDYKVEKENLLATPPNPGQIETARRKIIAELRKLEAAGAIRIAYGDAPAPETPASPAVAPTKANATMAVPPSPGPTVAGAKDTDPCPTTDTFKLETPPPGLSGERLETYLKSVFGK